MAEIYLLIIFFLFNLFMKANSLMKIMFSFFLFSLVISLLSSWMFFGWVGAVMFLVFVGGMLVIIFYLGMFSKFYSLQHQLPILGFILVFFSSANFVFPKILNFGDSSNYFFKVSFFLFLGGLLFFVLFLVSKIIGQGSSLRRLF